METKNIYFFLSLLCICTFSITSTEITWQRVYELQKQQPNFSPELPSGVVVNRVPNITCFVMSYSFAIDFCTQKKIEEAPKFFSSLSFMQNNSTLQALSHYTRPDPAVLQRVIEYEFKDIADRILFIDFSPQDHDDFFSGKNKGRWFNHYGYSNGKYYDSWRTCYDVSDWDKYVRCLQEFAAANTASCAFITHITGGMRHVIVCALQKKNGLISGFFYDSLNGDYYNKQLFEHIQKRIADDLEAVNCGLLTMTHNVPLSKISQETIRNCIYKAESLLNLETVISTVPLSNWFYETARQIESKKEITQTKLFHLLNGKNYEDPILLVSACEYFLQLRNIIFPQMSEPWKKYIEGNESYGQICYIDFELLKQASDSTQKLSWDQERLLKHAINRLSQNEDCYFLVKAENGQLISTQQ